MTVSSTVLPPYKTDWIANKFRLTLWCEHSRLPLPVLDKVEGCGVYDLELTKDWIQKSAPLLKVLSTTLSLALPIAMSASKLTMDSVAHKSIEDELKFGKSCADSFLKGSNKVGDWLTSEDKSTMEPGGASLAEDSTLRELHSLLKGKDPLNSFGGLVRVQNKRREFLWVHEQYKRHSEYGS